MKNLVMKYGVSRGRETYGWNIVTLWDRDIKYRTLGGGYDMIGSVFGDWLWSNYSEQIINKIKDRKEEFYGLFEYNGNYRIDGACGFDCIKKIAKEIGLKIECLYHNGDLTNIIVKEIQHDSKE